MKRLNISKLHTHEDLLSIDDLDIGDHFIIHIDGHTYIKTDLHTVICLEDGHHENVSEEEYLLKCFMLRKASKRTPIEDELLNKMREASWNLYLDPDHRSANHQNLTDLEKSNYILWNLQTFHKALSNVNVYYQDTSSIFFEKLIRGGHATKAQMRIDILSDQLKKAGIEPNTTLEERM